MAQKLPSVVRRRAGVRVHKPPVAASAGGLVYIKTGSGSLDAHASQYDLLIVSQEGITGAVAQTPPAVFYTSPQVNAAGDYAIDTATATANGWLLRDASNNLMSTSFFGQTLLDPGNQGARDAFAAEVIDRMNGWGADGIFHDDIQGLWSGFGGSFASGTPKSTVTGVAYTQATWEAAAVGWCQSVGAAVLAAGAKYMVFNATKFISGDSASDTGAMVAAFWTSIGGACNTHLCREYWCTNGSNFAKRLVGSAWNENWDGWQALVATTHTLGTSFLGLDPGGFAADQSVYSRASLLLDWQPGDLFGLDPPGWSAAWTGNVGSPLSAKYQVGQEWRREFGAGTVSVNPTTGVPSLPA